MNLLSAQTNRSLHFDGNIANRVDIPFVLNGSYTKEAWIKPDAASLNNFPNIISGDATALYLNFGLLSAGHSGSGFNNVQDNVPLVAGQWYHIAVTYNAANNEMKLYKNGVEVSSVSNAPTYTETVQHLSYFAGGNYFFGEMDEVRLWKSARSATEISNYKDCELTGDDPQLLAYYNFNQGTAGGNNATELLLLDRTDRCRLAYNALLSNFLLTGNTSNWVTSGATPNSICNFDFSNINITGNSTCIVNGDITPSGDDFTSFGNYFTVPVTRTFSIENTGTATLNVGSIQITGANASDFSVTATPSSTVAGNSSTNFTISFNATGAAGLKSAIITVNSDDADELMYSFAIEGTKADEGKSLDFDGVDDHIDLPFTISGSYTKEVWLKTFTQFGFPNVISGAGTAFFLNNGRIAAGHSPNFNQVIDPDTNPIATNTWYHFAVTYDTATLVMKLYKNGALIATATNVDNYTETIQKIGIFNNANFFFGRLDQVRFWNRAKTDVEILNSYNCKISGDEPGLIAWYNFSNGVAGGNNIGITTLLDEADKCNPNNGVLQNFNLDAPNSNWLSDSILTNSNCVAIFPNIRVNGNSICIINTDNSPEDANNTDFGNATPSGISKTFSITNTGTATLNVGNISFSGPDNSMFTLSTAPATTLVVGASTSFTVLFTPSSLGLKTATISILSDDTDESPYTFALQGTGINAALVINNIVASSNLNGTSTVTWNTDVAATSVIDYGTDPLNLNLTQGSAGLVTNHSVELTGLTLGVTYYYRVTSVDGSNNSVTSPTVPAAPLSFNMPPLITLQPVSATVCTAATVNLSSTAESDVALTVQWQISTNNGNSWIDSTGATSPSISFVASNADNGKQFRAVWTNAGGSNTSNAATITVNPTTSSTTNVTVCSTALPYSFNGNNYNAAGTYVVTLPNANEFGCDSIATLVLTVNPTSSSTINVTICSTALPYSFNSNNYNAAGTYVVTLAGANEFGCDSIATLVLTVNPTSSSTTNVTICSTALPYTFNGNNYNAAGTYVVTLAGANEFGCDSIATLVLTVNPTSSGTTNVTVCNTVLPYSFNGNNYSAAGTYPVTLPNANQFGCDSIATLVLTVNPTSSSTTNVTVCSTALPYSFNGNNYNAAGTYVVTLAGANEFGCDSIATLVLTVNPTSSSTTNVNLCSTALPYSFNGNNYNAAGTYVVTLPNANEFGCDSIATLVLTVNPTSSSTTNVIVCSTALPYSFNGNNYNAAGTYVVTLPNANEFGCDSIATLVLTVNPTSSSTTNVTVCSTALPYSFNGNNYNAAGTYVVTLAGANEFGCDSIATLDLTVNPTSSSTTNVNLCSTALPYSFNGNNYNAAGTYVVTLAGANEFGCDSIATLVLTVNPTSSSTTNVTICSTALPYSFNGNNYNAAGTYIVTLAGANEFGCDSIATLVLTVNPTSSSTTNVTICSTALPYSFNGNNYNAAGTYVVTLAGANEFGCDSIATLVLTVNPTSSSTTNVTVCSTALPYSFNGNNYNAAGTYVVTLPNANEFGCDSIATLVLTVNPTSRSTTNVTVCSTALPYSFNGNNYNAAGTYVVTLPNANEFGCDSIATLVLTVNPTSSSTTNVTVCSTALPYSFNGNNYNTAGTYAVTLAGANEFGCDSIATLVLTVNPTSSSTTNVIVCSTALPYSFNGNNYNAAGTYVLRLPNANEFGCDSIATLVLTVNPTSSSTTNVTVCSTALPYSFNGNNYNAAGTYVVTLAGANEFGCDSIATLVLTVNPTSSSTTNVTVCSTALPYTFNGNNYNAAGTYVLTLPNANEFGCDSIATLVLTVNPTSSSTTNVTVCSTSLPYSFNGNNYNAAGTYVVTLPNANEFGCDSIATLVLTVNPTSSSTTNVTLCSTSLPYSFNGNNYNAAGTYVVTLAGANEFGCDSIATLVLTVNPTSSSNTNVTVCSTALPYSFNGNNYNASGTYVVTLAGANEFGCDSIATLVLTVNPTSSSTTNVTLCSTALPYSFNGNNYNAAGTYLVTLPNANEFGCDSIATLVLTVNPTSSSTTNVTVCSTALPYTFNGNNYNAAGTYVLTLPNANEFGCDSIATLVLTVNPTSSSTTNVTVCSTSLPYSFNGNNYNAAGTYVVTLPNANEFGCDSIATLVLTVNPTSSSTTNVTVCSTALPYSFNGNNYNAAGTYVLTLPNANEFGCDSIATLVLTVNPTSSSTTNVTVCSTSLPYSFNGNNYNAAGTYVVTLAGANEFGCDSIATLVLTVNPSSTSTTNVTVCNTALPYSFNGNNYNAAGTYIVTLPNANEFGCDSIATLVLTVNPTSSSTTNVTVCSTALPYAFNGNNYNAAGTYVVTLAGANQFGCDSIATLVLTVNPTSSSTTNVTVCSTALPYSFNGNNYNAAGTYVVTLAGANEFGCDSIATLVLTVNPTSSSTTNVIVCSTALPYSFNGNNYNAAGTYVVTLAGANEFGCDSIATLVLTVNPTSSSTTNVTVCSTALPYSFNGNNYNAAGTYVVTLPNANQFGCDSIATLVLTVNPTSSSTTNVTVCSTALPYSFNGNNYNAAGTYVVTFAGANEFGCDSIATLVLTVNPTSSSTTNVTVCSTALPYSFNGNNYNAAGTYVVTLPNANEFGCDSIATLNLAVTNFTVVITTAPLACLDDINGSFTASASNGLAPFEYTINNGANWFPTGTFNNLSAGIYNLRIRDAAGCTKDTSVTVDIEKATWIGAVSSDWHTPPNWSNNQVPTATTHVIISNTSANECIISNNNAVAASIQAKTGVVVKVENSRTILIAGNCTNLPVN